LFLKKSSDVALTIYDVAGNRVIELLNEKKPAGKHHILWDGLNEQGQKVPGGIYFCHLKTSQAGQRNVIKMTVLSEKK